MRGNIGKLLKFNIRTLKVRYGLFQLCLRPVALDSVSQHIGQGFHEMRIVFGKRMGLVVMCSQDAERTVLAGDGNRQPAHHVVFDQQCGRRKAFLMLDVFGNHRFSPYKGVSALRIGAVRDRLVADPACLPAHTRP